MTKTQKNRVVVTENDKVKRIKSDKEIVDENQKLEKELKTKKEVEDEKMSVMLVEEKDRSINFGVLGSGQAGGKIAELMYNRGYTTMVLNTAMQDLKYINIPERNKLFLDYAIGGSAKDIDTGAAATEEYKEQIFEMMEEKFEDNEVLILITSGGGGSGSGSAETLVNLMAQLGKPIIVMFIMPQTSEDLLAKYNTTQTLAKLAKLAREDVVNSLMIFDNEKIGLLYPGRSLSEFWKVANEAIVEPLHIFNKLSSCPSPYTALDPMDFSRCLLSGDCSLVGMIEVSDFLEEDAIAEAVLLNMENGLLASEFDLTTTRSAGIILVAGKEVLSQIKASSLEYAFSMVNKLCSDSVQVFRGIYEVPNQNTLKVYSLMCGLGLPEERVQEMKSEALRHMEAFKDKENNRASNMTVDLGKTVAVSTADMVHKRIKQKNSAMSKIKKNSKRVVDRRRK